MQSKLVEINWLTNNKVTFKYDDKEYILISDKIKKLNFRKRKIYSINEANLHWNNLIALGFVQI